MTGTPLPGVLAPLGPLLDHYGYLAVAGLIIVEDFGVPAPGGDGADRRRGLRRGGPAEHPGGQRDRGGGRHHRGQHRVRGRPVRRAGAGPALRPVRAPDRRTAGPGEAFFARRGGKVVTFARFLEGLRQANGIIAGVSGMRWRKFLAFNALGAALWVALWASLGDLAGRHIGVIYQQITQYSLYALIALGVAILALVARHLARRRRSRRRKPS